VTRGFYKEESKIVSIPDTATKQDDTVDPDACRRTMPRHRIISGKRTHRNEGNKRKK
jgi:hypothetical protein